MEIFVGNKNQTRKGTEYDVQVGGHYYRYCQIEGRETCFKLDGKQELKKPVKMIWEDLPECIRAVHYQFLYGIGKCGVGAEQTRANSDSKRCTVKTVKK